MENIISIDIDPIECDRLAHEIFIEAAGIDRSGKKYERMRDAAFQIWEKIQPDVSGHLVCKYYEDVFLTGKTAVIDQQILTCNVFEQIENAAVEGVYVYAVCAGDFALPDEKIMNQLYADLWGTAFADAVRFLMERELENHAKCNYATLSDGFGPGFYGMDIAELSKFDKLLDFGSIGISLRNSSIMIPVKSCAGLFFQVNERYQRLDAACENCIGNVSSCQLCQVNRRE